MQQSLNSKTGAIALGAGSSMMLAFSILKPGMLAIIYLGWLIFSFGAVCFTDEMGMHKPLNRAGLVALAAAFCASSTRLTSIDPMVVARAGLTWSFTLLAALLCWSIALMHRPRTAGTAGSLVSIVSGGALLLLLISHILIGSISIFGSSQLFLALSDPRQSGQSAANIILEISWLWSLTAAWLLWKVDLSQGRG